MNDRLLTPGEVNPHESPGRNLYEAQTRNDPSIHCNRFPAWDELSLESQEKWSARASPQQAAGGVIYVPYDRDTANATDRVAWALCQIIDDDAPMRWTRYRFVAGCIAHNPEVMADLEQLGSENQ